MSCNTTNNCGCEPICGCPQPCDCAVPCQCPPPPCEEGCLTDTKTDCVFLSQDLDICSEILPKGSTVTEALEKLGEAVCDGVTVTVQDMKVKVDANDTTSGYLFDKLTVCNNLEKTVTNINGNETLQICSKIDTVSGGGNNILTSGPNGLYIPPFVSTGYNLTPLFSSSVDLLVNPVLGGQSILANIKKDTLSGGGDNILQIGPNGLYVPPPTAVNPTIVTKFDAPNSGILTTVTVAGNIYTISPKIKLDPSSTAPISLTTDGLKVDCCIPITPANTPITITPDPSIIFTATGIDSHTLYAKVKVDTVSSGNALVSGPNGLYCPAPGAASPTTIQTSPTVIATPINPTTYTLEVDKSTDSCNALVNGSDGALYVNGVEKPNSLNFITDGTDIYFEFQGPSTNSVDYEVEIQGTTGSPQTWVPGGFDSLNGVILRYYVAPVGVITETIRARVKYKCGANYSGWSSLTYVPEHTYISSNGSVTILPTGIPGEFDFTISSGICQSLNTSDFNNTVSYFKGNYIFSTTYLGTLNFGEHINVTILNGPIGITSFVIGESNRPYLFTYPLGLSPNPISFKYTRSCNFGLSSTIINTVPILQNCDTDWTPLPPFLNGWLNGTFSGDALSFYKNAGSPEYKISDDTLELRGTIIKPGPDLSFSTVNNSSFLQQNVIENLFDFNSMLPACFTAGSGNSYYGIKDNHQQIFGTWSYSSITPAYRHIDHVNLHVMSVGGVLKVLWEKTGQMLDPNQDLQVLFPVTNVSKLFSISLEGIKIKLS